VADFGEELGQLGKDLISRQVNLIIATGGMSAEPMPTDPVMSMREIYGWYHDRLLGPASGHIAIDAMTAADLHTAFLTLCESLTAATRQEDVQLAGSEGGAEQRTWKDVVGAAVDLLTNLFKKAKA
jgi:hypothetical protein